MKGMPSPPSGAYMWAAFSGHGSWGNRVERPFVEVRTGRWHSTLGWFWQRGIGDTHGRGCVCRE